MRSLSHVQLFATPWTVAHQALLSMGFSRQEHWSGLPLPSPGHPPNPGMEPGSPTLKADTLPSDPPGKSGIKAVSAAWQGRFLTTIPPGKPMKTFLILQYSTLKKYSSIVQQLSYRGWHRSEHLTIPIQALVPSFHQGAPLSTGSRS